jgi:hypothetical protein
MEGKTIEQLTEETINDGGYLCLVYFDLHGKSADEVKNTMTGFLSKLTNEKGVVYALGEIDVPLEKNGVFSTWAEVKLLVEDFATLVKIAIQYSPIGFEILKPDSVSLSIGQAQSILLDISDASNKFTSFIFEKVLSKEEIEEYKKKLQARYELGKKLIEKNPKKEA